MQNATLYSRYIFGMYPPLIRSFGGVIHFLNKNLFVTLGEKRQATVTLADKLMVTDMLVILSAT